MLQQVPITHMHPIAAKKAFLPNSKQLSVSTIFGLSGNLQLGSPAGDAIVAARPLVFT